MIQEFHKGVEIELQLHQSAHGNWKCDYTLITHPQRTQQFHRGDSEFSTMDLAKEFALQEARDTIDKNPAQFKSEIADPPREVRIKPFPD